MIAATYSPEDDKLRLYSTSRLGAETYARVKAAGLKWAPKQDLFVAPWTPEREDLLLDLCGEIGDEDTFLVARAEDRADRFEGYRENRAADAERAYQAVAAITDDIALGQPIIIGHHSEKPARRRAVLDNWGKGDNFTRTIPFDQLKVIMTAEEVQAARDAGRLVETEDKTGFYLTGEAPRATP